MNGKAEWDRARYDAELINLAGKINSAPPGSLDLATLQKWISHFPEEQQTATSALILGVYRANELAAKKLDYDFLIAIGAQEMDNRRVSMESRRESRAFWAGLAMLLIALLVSALVPTLNGNGTLILRVVAGAGLCLLIAFLPGLFSVDSKMNAKGVRITLRATGGFAGLVMVYLFDPGSLSLLIRTLFSAAKHGN